MSGDRGLATSHGGLLYLFLLFTFPMTVTSFNFSLDFSLHWQNYMQANSLSHNYHSQFTYTWLLKSPDLWSY